MVFYNYKARYLSLCQKHSWGQIKMGLTELALIALSCSQPIIIGLLAFMGLGRQVSSSDLAQSLSSMHQKLGNYRFYECATYSRLGSLVRYQISFFSVLIAYVVYDVDLVFFVSEAIMLSSYGIVGYCLLAFFILCMVIGL